MNFDEVAGLSVTVAGAVEMEHSAEGKARQATIHFPSFRLIHSSNDFAGAVPDWQLPLPLPSILSLSVNDASWLANDLSPFAVESQVETRLAFECELVPLCNRPCCVQCLNVCGIFFQYKF